MGLRRIRIAPVADTSVFVERREFTGVPPPENVAFMGRVQRIYQDEYTGNWNASSSEALAKAMNGLYLTETTEPGLSHEIQDWSCFGQVHPSKMARHRFRCNSRGRSNEVRMRPQLAIPLSALLVHDKFRVLEKR
jgi:hypothetical protein